MYNIIQTSISEINKFKSQSCFFRVNILNRSLKIHKKHLFNEICKKYDTRKYKSVYIEDIIF